MQAVAELPCVCCGARCDELHHPRSPFLGCGTGLKAPHWCVIPLCKKHHDDYHRLGNGPWEQRYGSQVDLMVAVWAKTRLTPEKMFEGLSGKPLARLQRIVEAVGTT